MTIPLVFRPIKQDSTLLYDGGIYNNFPWQVLQEDFKPDILIGSKCVEGNSKPKEDNPMEQILALTMMHTDYDLPSDEDILIDHTFDDVTTLDFSKAAYVIDRGYQDAMAKMPQILERVVRRADTTELDLRRAAYPHVVAETGVRQVRNQRDGQEADAVHEADFAARQKTRRAEVVRFRPVPFRIFQNAIRRRN